MTQNQIAWFVASENKRHNLAGESIDRHKADSQRISAAAATSQASAAHRQANASEVNALANAKNADTNRMNADTNWYNAQTGSMKQSLDEAKFEWQTIVDSGKLTNEATKNLVGAGNIIGKFLPK